MGTLHVGDVPLLAQAPVHPRKLCFCPLGFAVSVTVVPTGRACEQCLPQLRANLRAYLCGELNRGL